MATRPVKRLVKAKPTLEGAGVRLRQPLKEPVAWYGPIVMNTQEELRHAFAQLKDDTFLRPDAPR